MAHNAKVIEGLQTIVTDLAQQADGQERRKERDAGV